MCIVFWFINDSSKIKFVLLFNREEFSSRPTAPLQIYEIEDILQNQLAFGKDLKEGGTWLSYNIQTGVIAFVTNRTPIFNVQKNKIKHKFNYLKGLLLSKYKSRGQLILNLTKSREKKEKCKFAEKHEGNMSKIEIALPQKQDTNLSWLAMAALIHREKYRPFNLFLGSITEQKFYKLDWDIQNYNDMHLPTGIGSVCSYGEFGTEIEKQQIGKEKFSNIINSFKDGEEEELIQKLFLFAQERFKSSEKFFSVVEEESYFFIKEYQSKLFKEKRGTRSTTIIINIDEKIKIYEKIYI